MTKLSPKNLYRILLEDVIAAQESLGQQDTPNRRRDLVRTIFAAIEGLLWQVKRDVFTHPNLSLSHHEHAAMAEETYVVDDRGNVKDVPRYLPLPHAIRLVVQMVQRYRPGYTVDYGHQGWSNLKIAIEVRNRLVHPKTLEDMSVSNIDLQASMSGFYWVLAVAIEVLDENNKALAETRDKLRAFLLDDAAGAD